jgi:hypothetical protein
MKRCVICAFVLLFSVVGVWGQEATPEITPEATALPLSENYTSEDGTFSFSYPSDFLPHVSETEGGYGAYFATSDNLIGPFDLELESGETVFSISVTELSAIDPRAVSVIPEDLLNSVNMIFDTDRHPYTEIDSLTLNDFPLALGIKRLFAFENAALVMDYGNELVVVVVVATAPDELNLWLPTAFAIAESITYNPTPEVTAEPTAEIILEARALTLSETYTSEDGTFSFRYPSNWFFGGAGGLDMNLFFANTQDAAEVDAVLRTGEVQIEVNGIRLVDLLSNLQLDEDADLGEVIETSIKRIFGEDVSISSEDLFSIDEFPAASVILEAGANDVYYLYVKLSDDLIASVWVTAAHGELNHWLPTALAIAESIQINEP